jgi:hypothetical protein
MVLLGNSDGGARTKPLHIVLHASACDARHAAAAGAAVLRRTLERQAVRKTEFARTVFHAWAAWSQRVKLVRARLDAYEAKTRRARLSKAFERWAFGDEDEDEVYVRAVTFITGRPSRIAGDGSARTNAVAIADICHKLPLRGRWQFAYYDGYETSTSVHAWFTTSSASVAELWSKVMDDHILRSVRGLFGVFGSVRVFNPASASTSGWYDARTWASTWARATKLCDA